ncbi:uncharacterized protein LOC117794003 [Drosophila innubila]|uniref:uncharacterized protein LOC117794003 n=1 Tax=Drosophila innubila TaxID=198719 RepID=UPI00148DFF03|nr:uncharacterized protein LOC117794003 [Drosophila innubila]
MQEEREDTNNCMQILHTSYRHQCEIISFLDDDRIKNMVRFTILSKQNEVQQKLNIIEEEQNSDLECKAAMERRKIVKEFRKCQLLLKEAKEDCLNTELENQQLDHQWKIKIKRATQQRNKLIVLLIETRKKIDHVSAILQFKVPNVYRPSMQILCPRKGLVLRGKNGPIALQSAMDFLKKYPCEVAEKLNVKNVNVKDVDQPLRSILVVNRHQEGCDESSQTKKVYCLNVLLYKKSKCCLN